MPSGKVKFYDSERGFGFIAGDGVGEVFLPSSALPREVTSLKPGTRVEFDVADGRRGAQALALRVLEPRPSIARAKRKPADDQAVLIEDLIGLLDGVSNDLRRGRYPDSAQSKKLASVLRAVADDFEG